MTRPSIWHCDPTQFTDHTRGPGYVIVGHVDSSDHAEAHGGHVGDGETAVWVPAEVIDGLVWERVNEAERTLTDRIVARLLRIADDTGEVNPQMRNGLLLAAGEAKYERLYEPDDPKEPTP